MDAKYSQTLAKFAGVDSVSEQTRLFPKVIDNTYIYPIAQGNNIEIDNTFGVKSRSGYTLRTSGTSIHSLWGDSRICLFADGASLKKMDAAYNVTTLRSGLGSERISYVRVNDRIYYTNTEQIGYILNDVACELLDNEKEFKQALPAGQLIEYFMGCLYVAKGNVLYISDPLSDCYDTRYGYRIFADTITMVKAVDDGLYVSDSIVWFVKGKGNDEFNRTEVYGSPAIPHTAVSVNSRDIGSDIQSLAAIWTSQNGICLGVDGGRVTNLTESVYELTPTVTGAAFVRDTGGVKHYINVLY